jgi:hypothetical protein
MLVSDPASLPHKTHQLTFLSSLLLSADVFPALFEKNKAIQLIAVGPVIDLYGRFAAEKLARLMEYVFPTLLSCS